MRTFYFLLITFCFLFSYKSNADNKYHTIYPNYFATKNKTSNVNIAYAGGNNTLNSEWKTKVNDYLTTKFPDAKFTDVSSPFGGVIGHAFSLKKNLYSKVIPDVLFVETVTEDRENKYPIEYQRLSVEGIIRAALTKNPNMDIFMLCIPNKSMLEEYKKGQEPKEIKLQKEIAKYYGVNVIDLSKEIYEKIENGDITSDDYFANNTDLNFESIRGVLDNLITSQEKVKREKLPKHLNKKCFENGDLGEIESANSAPMFTYHKSYTPKDDAKTYDGYTAVPMLVGEKPDNSFFYEFKGNAIGFVIISGPDAGILQYMINSERDEEKMINLFEPDSENSHKPKFVMLASDLSNGINFLAMQITSSKSAKSKGTACRIVHFLVNN